MTERLITHATTVEADGERRSLLTINGGSSSIRFAVYEARTTLQRRLDGKIDRIGLSGTNLLVSDPAGPPQVARLKAADHRAAVDFLLEWLEAQPVFVGQGGGHRVVHGLKHSEPERVTPMLLKELRRLTPYDPDHLPREIRLIEAFMRRHPKLPQVACFDTAFHRTMPRVAKLLSIPRLGEGVDAWFPRTVLRVFDGGTRPPRPGARAV